MSHSIESHAEKGHSTEKQESFDDIAVLEANRLQLDTGIEYIRCRRRFWQLW